MARNLVTSLPGKPRRHPMERFDRLPPDLRCWLSQAVLPWSPHSALRLWTRLRLETGGNLPRMLERLDQAEQRLISRDGAVFRGGQTPGAPVPGRNVPGRNAASPNVASPNVTGANISGGVVSCLEDPICTGHRFTGQ